MDHDRLFKQLLSWFFVEFLELFFPQLVEQLDRRSIEFLDKEVFTDLTAGERHEVDLVAKGRFRDQELCFLIHVELQAQRQSEFHRRMFTYFARLHEKYGLPVYPIAVFTYLQPQREEADEYRVVFSDLEVLLFRYRVLQLNRLDWRGFVERSNPVAAALMARMRMAPDERPGVKVACLALLARLQLDAAQRELLSAFIDAYLPLTMDEEAKFETELANLDPEGREHIMELVTSWMKKGIEQGLEQGMQKGREEGIRKGLEEGIHHGKQAVVLRLLHKRLGELDEAVESRVRGLSADGLEELAEALLDFREPFDLTTWLDGHA